MKKGYYFPKFKLKEITKERIKKLSKATWRISLKDKVICELHGRVEIEEAVFENEVIERAVLCPEVQKYGGRGKQLFMCVMCRHFRCIERVLEEV